MNRQYHNSKHFFLFEIADSLQDYLASMNWSELDVTPDCLSSAISLVMDHLH